MTHRTGIDTGASRRPFLTSMRALAIAMLLTAIALSIGAMSFRRANHQTTLAARQKYERGISGLADASPSELLARVKYFETAIGADSRFAPAYAGHANAKLLIGAYRVEPAQASYAAAKAAAVTALALDAALPDAHAAYGAAVLFFEWDWAGARSHLQRAVALDPRSASAQLWWSRYLTASGDHAAAIAAASRVVTLAPGSPSALTQLGIAHYYARHGDEARQACSEAIALMREFEPARACIESVNAGRTSPNFLLTPAIDFARHGERDKAIDWLQRAANRRSDSLVFAAVEPGFDSLRDDSRFGAVLRRVGWPIR